MTDEPQNAAEDWAITLWPTVLSLARKYSRHEGQAGLHALEWIESREGVPQDRMKELVKAEKRRKIEREKALDVFGPSIPPRGAW